MNLPPITKNRAQSNPQASTVLSSTERLSGARARNRFPSFDHDYRYAEHDHET
jgi:hypothetical protein